MKIETALSTLYIFAQETTVLIGQFHKELVSLTEISPDQFPETERGECGWCAHVKIKCGGCTSNAISTYGGMPSVLD